MQEHPLGAAMEPDSRLVNYMKNAEHTVYVDGALPKKVKLLIAMAFAAAYGAVNGVKSLAQSAMKAGATKEEIAEALRITYHLGAG